MRIWREGGWLERIGLIVMALSFVVCFLDIVDFEPLPKALDKLAIAFPLMLAAWALILGGQWLRHRAQDKKRPPSSTG